MTSTKDLRPLSNHQFYIDLMLRGTVPVAANVLVFIRRIGAFKDYTISPRVQAVAEPAEAVSV